MDVVTYALAKKYVNKTANALGAVKGAPCIIKSIVDNITDIVVTFEWTGKDGTIQTSVMTVPVGKSLEFHWDGTKLGIRLEGETDYEYVDLQGDSPIAEVKKVDKKTTITITDKNGSTTADILDGQAFESANVKPTKVGAIGEIILNGIPMPGGYVGWVYTALGWFGFGKIELEQLPFTLSDGSIFTLLNGDAFCVSG